MDHNDFDMSEFVRNFLNNPYAKFAADANDSAYSFRGFADLLNDGTRWHYTYEEEQIPKFTSNARISDGPPGKHIDAGIDLKEGIIITVKDWVMLSVAEYNEVIRLVEQYVNIQSEELLERKLLHIHSDRPCITTLV